MSRGGGRGRGGGGAGAFGGMMTLMRPGFCAGPPAAGVSPCCGVPRPVMTLRLVS